MVTHPKMLSLYLWVGPRGVMDKAMDYYVHFRANTPGKGMNPLILSALG